MHYLMKGLNLIRVKGLKRYVVVPLCINLVLFALAFGYLFSQLGGWVESGGGNLAGLAEFYRLFSLAFGAVFYCDGFSFNLHHGRQFYRSPL